VQAEGAPLAEYPEGRRPRAERRKQGTHGITRSTRAGRRRGSQRADTALVLRTISVNGSVYNAGTSGGGRKSLAEGERSGGTGETTAGEVRRGECFPLGEEGAGSKVEERKGGHRL